MRPLFQHPPRRVRRSACVAVALCAATALGAAPDASPEEGLKAMSGFQFADAAAVFEQAARHGAGGLSRDLRLASGLSRLNRPGRSDETVSQIAREFSVLIEQNPSDDTGLWAAYHLARIEQIHARPARPLAALERFRALLALAPAHPAAQEALLRIVVLSLYEPALSLTREGRVAAALALEPLVQPTSRAAYHLVLARGLLFHDIDRSAALVHLERAQAAGLADPALRRATWVSIGQLSEEAGDSDRALACYKAFLAEALSDKRIHVIRERVARLEATRPAASTGLAAAPATKGDGT